MSTSFPLLITLTELAPFVQTCGENLKLWQERYSKLSANELAGQDSSSSNSMSPTQVPEDFLTAFPPALPRSFLAQFENAGMSFDLASDYFTRSSPGGSRPSSSASAPFSHYETCPSYSPSPSSPFRVDHPTPTQPPRLEITTSPAPSTGRAPSVTSSTSFINPQDATAAIRAAYDASVRKKKSFHRTSWNPSPAEFSAEIVGRPFRMQSPSSPSAFGSPLSPPSASTISPSPLTPPSLQPNQSTLSVFQSVPSC